MDGVEVVRLGLAPDLVPYEVAWAEQRRLHGQVAAHSVGRSGGGSRGRRGTVLLLEHEPVYTAGRRTQDWERPTDGSPVVDVDRGGRITWHGPGQLVGYPILRLPEPIDVVGYVRELEQLLIEVCADLGLHAGRLEGRSGVWVPGDCGRPDRKVAAIGVRVARGVTMHGFALNCDCDLSWYARIVACGIEDASVTSLTVELDRPVTVRDALPLVELRLGSLLARRRVPA